MTSPASEQGRNSERVTGLRLLFPCHGSAPGCPPASSPRRPARASVPASEDRDQIALLCRTYETCSIPERQFLRALAQRAITEAIAERKRAVAGHR